MAQHPCCPCCHNSSTLTVYAPVQSPALRRAVEDLVGCPAFLVHQFRARHHVSSGGLAESRPEAHNLDLAAVDRTWSTLLRVRPMVVLAC